MRIPDKPQIGVQQFFIILFAVLAVRFHHKLRAQPPSWPIARAFRLLYVLYAVLVLITIRIIKNLAEYANGLDSEMPKHEAYLYALDSTPMLIALVLFNIIHPGSVMPGRESDLPSRKERKRMRKEAKSAKLAGNDAAYESVPVDYGRSASPEHGRAASPEYGVVTSYGEHRDYDAYRHEAVPLQQV